MRRFIDTNILLYAISKAPNEAGKQAISRGILATDDCILSAQILNEFFVRATKSKNPYRLSSEEAWRVMTVWRRFTVLPVDAALIDAAWRLFRRTNYAWWDCLVVAAAQASNSATLVSEDMQHGHVVDGVRIENPFRDLADPAPISPA